jgi:hypothetical protein
VPPLKDFVMNRVSGDYFENLLYKVFVTLDERTSAEKLATILDIDIDLVKVQSNFSCCIFQCQFNEILKFLDFV